VNTTRPYDIRKHEISDVLPPIPEMPLSHTAERAQASRSAGRLAAEHEEIAIIDDADRLIIEATAYRIDSPLADHHFWNSYIAEVERRGLEMCA
jgi:hypothetical protein